MKSIQVEGQLFQSEATPLGNILSILTGDQTPRVVRWDGRRGQALTQIEMSHASFVNGRERLSRGALSPAACSFGKLEAAASERRRRSAGEVQVHASPPLIYDMYSQKVTHI